MKTEIKITLYIVFGLCFCVFCVCGCEVLCDPSDAVKLKEAELSLQSNRHQFVIDSLERVEEKELKKLLIEKGEKNINPKPGYSTREN